MLGATSGSELSDESHNNKPMLRQVQKQQMQAMTTRRNFPHADVSKYKQCAGSFANLVSCVKLCVDEDVVAGLLWVNPCVKSCVRVRV